MTSFSSKNIRVLVDLQGYQRESNRVRGIGRYSIQLVKSLIKRYPANIYILFSNSSLYDFRKDFIDELNDAQLNVIYFEWTPPGKINDDIFSDYSRNSVAKQIRSYALSVINSDIILLTSFFDGFKDNTLIDFDRHYQLPPVVAVIYDLIPLIMPKMYLDNDEEYRYFYYQKIKDLTKLDALLTISESAKNELKKYVRFDNKRIFNISSSFDYKYFYKDLKGTEDLSINVNDFGKYILCSSAADPRKNLFQLLKAYSMLPLHLIDKHRLVLTGPFSVTESQLISFWLDELNINPQNVIILGYVKDYDLANLYRNSYLFVFPSLHEGFGLPVLEAIICGAVVIASNVTSIPEIISYEPALFDPYNVINLKDLIIRALTDLKFRNSIIDHTSDLSSTFCWERTADKVMDSIVRIIEINPYITSNNQTFSTYNAHIKENYNHLIRTLKTNPIIKSQLSTEINFIQIVSASIALVNEQIKKIYLSYWPNIKKMIWRIEGPFDSSYSLSIVNKNFALALANTGQDVELYSTEGPGDFTPSIEYLHKNPLINLLYQKSQTSKNDIFITSRNLYPPRVDDLDSYINLLHAYGWEESSIPAEWVEKFNKSLTGLTVMSNQVKKILIDNGVSLPIKICGLGVDHIDQLGDNIKFDLKKKKYAFLHISSCFPRKGIECLLESYGRAFSKFDDVSLIIKTFKNEHNNIDNLLEKYYSINPNYPDVNVIYSDLNDAEIKSIYQQCDVLVAPSHGEGFNLTVAEAMRLGLPVITTAWGGQMDFCSPDNAWLIDYEFDYSETHLSTASSVWAKPSYIHLSQLLKEVYIAPSSLLSSRINAGKQSISNYTWENMATKNQDFVLELCTSCSIKKPIVGVISTWNTRCGIATYSEHLLSQFDDNVIIFSSNNNINKNDKSIRCWNLGNDNLNELFERILENNITSILIQFNYGFFEFSAFSNFLKRLHENGIKTLVIIHSTIDPKNDQTKKLKFLAKQLASCNRLLVHTPSDLNRLKNLGLIDNVTLFPHGILEVDKYKRKNDLIKYTNQDLHFSTFGFCLPNKGFKELIKAIKILHKEKIICKLTLYTSLYDNSSSSDLLRSLKLLIHELKLSKYVQIDSSFLADDEILKNLSNTDLVIFPYQSTNESASGAVRQGISSLAPVAVTPVPIFDDVLDVVYQLPGCSSSSIASGLVKWVRDCYGVPMNSKEINWRKQHSFKLLAYRLQGMIRGIEINE
tara:strand:- start:1762 stop:5421 length:3660 start_codon:yes stop_codon:yes gene_type:complete